MNDTFAKQVADLIIKDIFGRENPYSLDDIRRVFTQGIALPVKTTCTVTQKEVFIYDPQPDQAVISEEGYAQTMKNEDWLRPARQLGSIEEVLQAWQEVRFMTADKANNSKDVAKSDSIIASSEIYESTLIGNSKKILFSHNNFFSNYLIACRGNSSCNFGLRMFDSLYCTSGYEIRWSNKVSKSFFINDCLDLYECMFCYGIRSKKYCIANMQYEQAEYARIKALVVDWIFQTKK